MLDLYSCNTPNGQKVHIFLEEAQLEYEIRWVDITKGDQFEPAFHKVSPNNKIPAIVDFDGPDGEPISVFESGAILIYLADKTGKFLPTAQRARTEVMEWLMFQMANVGPMLGQAHHFRAYCPERVPYAIERYTKEAARIYRVLDDRLAEREFVADEYSIADMAIFPWCARYEWQGIALEEFPNVKRWFDTLMARPAVQRGMEPLV